MPIVLCLFLLYYFFLGLDEVISAYIAAPGSIEKRLPFLAMRNEVRDLSFLIWLIYAAVAEATSMQGTLGKKLLGIKVVDKEGNRLSFGRAIIRNLAKILSLIPFGLGFLWAGFSKEKRGWHDYIARTYVVQDLKETEYLEIDGSLETAPAE
jgi:uncharacterized RDD family membrane protein YckC